MRSMNKKRRPLILILTLAMLAAMLITGCGNKTGGKSDVAAEEPEAPAEPFDIWSKTWYGYIYVSTASGYWEENEDALSDVSMIIGVDDEQNPYMTMYFDEGDVHDVDAYIAWDEAHFEVINGWFWDMALDPSVWRVERSPADEGELIVISDAYVDPERTSSDRFEYTIRLRPYGEEWTQEADAGEMLPPSYEEYLALIQAGTPDPVLAKAEGRVGGQGAAQEAPLEQTDKPGTAQRLPAADLRKAYDAIDSLPLDEYFSLSYKVMVEEFLNGVEGDIYGQGDSYITYEWKAQEADYQNMSVTFKPREGYDEWCLDSMSIGNID